MEVEQKPLGSCLKGVVGAGAVACKSRQFSLDVVQAFVNFGRAGVQESMEQ